VRVLKNEDLAVLGIPPGNTSNFIYDGKEFQIGPTFSLKMRSEAINFCEREESEGRECLLIERATAVTVWRSITPSSAKSSPQLDKQLFIEQCHQELTKSIGPIATVIIKELVNSSEPLTATQLIDRVAAEIPDSSLAEQFKTNLRAKLQERK
jgi:hypothetical protein